MKVAIIGAGLSGLSCAIELERHKIKPVIFEKRAHVGEALSYSIILPRIINRPITDPLKYLKKEYALELIPHNHLKKMIMRSPSKRAVQRGSQGYIFRRGYPGNSMEMQLLNYVDSPVTFNSYVEAEEIKNEFDYVIVADANSATAKRFGLWTDTFNAQVRVATILGSFKSNQISMWADTSYSKNGFCYLIPSSTKEASLVQIVNGITTYELDHYWKKFLFTEDIQYYISDTADTEHDSGFVQPRRIDNILFVGNSAGLTDNLIGCGALNAIESGMLAARSIAFSKDYTVLTEPIFRDIEKLHEFRKAINTMGNREMDCLINALAFPVIKKAMYNNPLFRLSHASRTARLYNSLIKSRRNPVE